MDISTTGELPLKNWLGYIKCLESNISKVSTFQPLFQIYVKNNKNYDYETDFSFFFYKLRGGRRKIKRKIKHKKHQNDV